MKYDLIIWDFNGTISDDVQIGIDAANVVLSRRGMKTIDSFEEYRKIFCFPIIKYYERLGFDFSVEPYEIPANEWTAEYIKRESNMKLTKGCLEALKAIKKSGVTQIIISSSEITMLRRELKILGVDRFFSEILGKPDNYAYGKVEMAKEWAKGKDYTALFIGDSVHDLETAVALGTDCVLYSGGHDSIEHLESCGVPVIDDLSLIPEYLN
ncbi:MAG: HAD family hydrolase [Clostridia bacterium]|nr:HAD family hydrolase [Clostridia bacterium]